MKNSIKSNLNLKKVIVLLILTNLVYAYMLIITIPKVMSFSGGMNLLDMMPAGYDDEYVNSLFSALGGKGRNTYLLNQLPVDMIYPFLFGITYCLLLAFTLNKLGKLEGYLYYLCFLPLFAGLFDYSENFGLIAMLNSYPYNPAILTSVTNVSTILKSSLTTLYFLFLIISLIVFGIQAYCANSNRHSFKSKMH